MKISKILNATKHYVDILGEINGEERKIASYPPCGMTIRLPQEIEHTQTLENGVKVTHTHYGSPEGLPQEVPGVYHIVSALVKNACADRNDLLVPVNLVKDHTGKNMGCRSLGI
ncbi:hypothetical protein FACS1894204_11870 [Synergistales bacterium]|nr:hypothetical protein FACS1894204_11870 [Synergistales bacterium]